MLWLQTVEQVAQFPMLGNSLALAEMTEPGARSALMPASRVHQRQRRSNSHFSST